MSVAVMVAFGISCARVMPITPEPVPMSQMLGLLQVMLFGELSAKVNEQFSFGSWNEYAWVYLEVTAVELFFAEDVG